MLNGYKTIIANILMVSLGLIGVKVDQALAMQYADAFILLWGLLNLILRAVTSAPIFNRNKPPAVNHSILALALVLPALTVGLSACATPKAETLEQRVWALEADFQFAQRAALAAIQSGSLSANTQAHIRRLEAIAYASVSAARAAARKGEDVGLPAALAAAREAVERLTDYLHHGGAI
ncbi:hypothetical protein [Telmatospirillum sp. J64-1]|uniref:hypothetical protein n=1 Tax=Telmatospirillum sp. J64-1 TaxID=2502183 RepID=UPI00115EDFC8|nr:hypothetical protein [Telmatospirillum sp. J64-1]